MSETVKQSITIKKRGDFKVIVERYVKPETKCNPFSIINYLDKMDEQLGRTTTDFNGANAKLLVFDNVFTIVKGEAKCLKGLITNPVFKQALQEEAVGFISDYAIYCQWIGSVCAPVTDVYYSVFNAIKDYVLNNWEKENKYEFLTMID